MQARNQRTGAAFTGTLERIYGEARLIDDAFTRTGDGRITHQHEGGTKMFWDSSEQVTATANGERIYLDENGDHVRESNIELHQGSPTDRSR